MGKISSRQVEAFRAVMLTGSMTAAAEFMSITQPAVSRLILDFEGLSGLQLFERKANHLIPTRDAIFLAEEVQRAFVGLDRIENFIKAIRTQTAGSLRMAAMPALATEILPRFAARFLQQRSSIHISLNGYTSPVVTECVASGEVDFGYIMGPIDRLGFYIEKISSPIVIAMRYDHPLASKRVIKPSDLSGQTVVGSFDNLFQAKINVTLAGIELSVVETRLAHVACVMVAEGIGLTFVDPFMLGIFRDRGLIARRFEPEIPNDFALIISQKRMPTPLAETFISGFRTYLNALRITAFDDGPNTGGRL